MVVQQCSQEALKLDAFCGRDPHVSGSLHLQQLNSSILNHLPNSVGFAQPLEPSTSWCLCPDFHLYGNLKRKFLICTVDFQECLGLLQHLGPSFGQGEWVNKIFWSPTVIPPKKNKHTNRTTKKAPKKPGNFAKLSRHQPTIQNSFVHFDNTSGKTARCTKKTHVLPQKMHKKYHTSHHQRKTPSKKHTTTSQTNGLAVKSIQN